MLTFKQSDGVRLSYSVTGHGEPVILLHGFAVDTNLVWQKSGYVDALAQDFQVIGLDLRGHGESAKPPSASQYGALMAEDIVGLLDHLGYPRAAVVGYSMGGKIALKATMSHPERFTCATTIGTGWATEGSTSDASYEGMGRRLKTCGEGVSVAQALYRSEEGIAPDVLSVINRNDPIALAAVCDRAGEWAVAQSDLENNEVPYLAVIGGLDDFRDEFDDLSRVTANIAPRLIEGRTHYDILMAPEVLPLLRSHLAQHTLRARG